MKARRTDRFAKQLYAAPARVQKNFEKQLGFLLQDPRHGSLRAKKFDGDTYVLLSIIPHPK